MSLPIIPIIKSVTDLRYQTADIIKLLDQNQPVVVTKDSNTVAILISPKQYEQLLFLSEELEDQKSAKKLERAIDRGGNFTDFQTFDKKQGKRLKIS